MPLLQELQRGPAAGADVRDFVGQPELFDRRGAVAAAYDAGGAVFLRGGGDGFGDLLRAVGEGLFFEDTHWAVPDNRLCFANLSSKEPGRSRADIQRLEIGKN